MPTHSIQQIVLTLSNTIHAQNTEDQASKTWGVFNFENTAFRYHFTKDFNIQL